VPNPVSAPPRTLTTTEAVVLGLLTEEERSGYDLLKRAEASVAHLWAPAKSQLYAVLPRLVAAGLATVRTVRQQARPDKNIYRPTANGRRALREWLDESQPKSWDEVMLKVFFAGLASHEAIVRQLREFAQTQRDLLEEYQTIRPRTRYGELTLRYGLDLMPARLAWLDNAIEELSR
jgi:DNA-binding PadR family transcriptional regulator